MRPPLRSVRMGFLKNSASPMRRRLGVAMWGSVRQRVGDSERLGVGDSERLGVGESVGHGDVVECGSWRRESQRVSAEGESQGESEARWKRAIFSNPTHAERQRRVRGVMADVHAYAYALRRCATTGERGGRSAGRTRFQLTPDSASGDRVEREICTARRCR